MRQDLPLRTSTWLPRPRTGGQVPTAKCRVKMKTVRPLVVPERALLVGVHLPTRYNGSDADSLAELTELARSASA